MPGDNDVILIPADKVVTVNGTDQTLDNAILVIEGELIMDSPSEFFSNYSSLTFTGSSSGVIVEDGGKITDGTTFGGPTHFIKVQGVKYWSGDNCVMGCGSTTGSYTSSGETGMPASIANPLPVELLYCRASFQTNHVFLEWATATEYKNSHFDVERSENGLEFTKIGDVAAVEHSKTKSFYFFEDINILNQKFSKLFYRLKQIDFDGHYKYSKAVTINNSYFHHENIIISPNPFTEKIHIDFKISYQDNIIIKLYDINGQLLMMQPWINKENNNKIEIGEMAHLPAGIYFIELTGNSVSILEKIIKS